MMECNKEEAIRAKEIAEKKMEGKDFVGALKIASKAQRLYPDLDNIEQMILVCDVLCAAENKICGNESDWYDILKVDPTANGATVKKQYRKFALLLHPDKNKFPGAADAFKMIGEAQKVLLDYDKRALFDKKRISLGKSFVPMHQSSRQSKAQSSSNFAPKSGNQPHQQPRKWTKSGGATEQPTFWTICSSCSVKYQYYRAMKDKTLWCHQCETLFTAREINTPGASTGTTFNQSAPMKQNDISQSHVKINPRTTPVNLTTKTTVQGRSGEYNTKGRTDSKVSTESNSQQYPRKSTRSRQHDEDELVNSSKRSKTVGSFPSKNENSEDLFVDPSGPRSSTVTAPEIFEYPGSDLSDFDQIRKKECFKDGQIWAFYDMLDAMPRFYAVINQVLSPGFKLLITWLEPDPDNEDERKWVLEGLPATCGKFRLGSSEIIKDLLMLSHMVCWEKGKSKNSYKVYPKKGETWALFVNWDMNWHSHTEIKRKYEYEFVEVLSDYTDSSSGVHVAPLVKVKGFVCLFHRKEERGLVHIPAKELFRFSHRVPCCQMTGMEGEEVPKGSFELDPASLPISSKEKCFLSH